MTPSPAEAGRRLLGRLDELVARTPPDRERYVDFLRVLAISVVIIWHWSLSVTSWTGDRFIHPNPINTIPAGWLLTWVLQIMPVFFIVGGYANYAAWQADRKCGRPWTVFLARRLWRLLVPVAVFLAVWVAFELVAHAVVDGYAGVTHYAWMVFTPLWFIGAYTGVVLLSPLTATLHTRAPWLTIGVMAGLVISADVGRFAGGAEWLGVLNTGLVWVLIHQFGYFYRDGTLTRLGTAPAVALAAGGAATLAALTVVGPYPRSMVAVPGQEFSNILPTTVSIAAVAVLQLGLIMAARDRLSRWLREPALWRMCVAGNSVILTVFVWHMTAMLIVLVGYRAIGGELLADPTFVWWLQRSFWLVAPAVVLVILVAIFGRAENTPFPALPGRFRR